VLVADDDSALRAIVRVAFGSEGWQVFEAETPQDTIDLAKQRRPDIVLLDVVFTGQARDGFSICRELKSTEATRRIPVVMLTAHDNAENRAFASAVGATAYLAKPFGALDLLRLVQIVREGGSDPGLGLYLVDAGVIKPTQLERALAEQRLRQDPRPSVGEILVELGFANESEVRRALLRQQRSRDYASAPRPAKQIRVVVADDHLSVREGLRAVLSTDEGFELVGVASDGEEALEIVRAQQPDLVVLDSDMPKRTGLEVLRTIQTDLPQVDVVMFTLDDGIREAALRAGASAVVTKDAPLRTLIAELRRAAARRGSAAAKTGVVLASPGVSHDGWGVIARRQRGLAVIGVLMVAFAGAFLVAEPVLGASAAILVLIPISLAGALLGIEAGVITALLAAIATAALWQGTGHEVGEPVLSVGGNGLGFLALMGVGAGFGLMRQLRGRLDVGSRRASALAEAALTLELGAGPDTLALLTRAALEVVPADAALLYAAVPGGGLELVGAYGAPSAKIGQRETGGPLIATYENGQARQLSAAEAATMAADGRRVRSGIVAPVGERGERPIGVMAVFATREDRLREVHVEALRTYTAFVGIALVTPLQSHAVGRRNLLSV